MNRRDRARPGPVPSNVLSAAPTLPRWTCYDA